MAQTTLINSLRDKVGQVIADNRRLREKTGKMAAEIERLKAERTQLQQQLSQAEHRVTVLELAGSMGGGAQQNKLAKARVNRLMREVDKCIALINK